MHYYLKRMHSLWHETEHYLLGNFRVDSLLQSETNMLKYYDSILRTISITHLTNLF